MDLSEFNVNVITGNNRAHQRPYSPEIQKRLLFLVKPQENILPGDPSIGLAFFRVFLLSPGGIAVPVSSPLVFLIEANG